MRSQESQRRRDETRTPVMVEDGVASAFRARSITVSKLLPCRNWRANFPSSHVPNSARFPRYFVVPSTKISKSLRGSKSGNFSPIISTMTSRQVAPLLVEEGVGEQLDGVEDDEAFSTNASLEKRCEGYGVQRFLP